MATSGSVNFTQTSGELVKDSLILLGVSFPGEVIQTETKNFALNMLNKIVKDLSAQGAKMWGLEEAVILFDNDVVAYTFADKSASGGKVAVGIKSSGLVKTALSADEAALQTVLTVDSSTGMSASDNVIIQLDSGDRHETTIVSVDDATTITITAAIPVLRESPLARRYVDQLGDNLPVYQTVEDLGGAARQRADGRDEKGTSAPHPRA